MGFISLPLCINIVRQFGVFRFQALLLFICQCFPPAHILCVIISINIWSFPVLVVYCPALPPPENGFFVQNVCNNHFDAACGIRCLPDFDLQGTSIRLCQANGTWSGTTTSCKGEVQFLWSFLQIASNLLTNRVTDVYFLYM